METIMLKLADSAQPIHLILSTCDNSRDLPRSYSSVYNYAIEKNIHTFVLHIFGKHVRKFPLLKRSKYICCILSWNCRDSFSSCSERLLYIPDFHIDEKKALCFFKIHFAAKNNLNTLRETRCHTIHKTQLLV